MFNSKQLGYKRNEKDYDWQSKFKTTDEKTIESLQQQLKAEQDAHQELREKVDNLIEDVNCEVAFLEDVKDNGIVSSAIMHLKSAIEGVKADQ